MEHPTDSDRQLDVSISPTQRAAVALIKMASRGTRSQADFAAALRGAGIVLTRAESEALLRELADGGLIENPILLLDGGVLVTVTDAAWRQFRRSRGAG